MSISVSGKCDNWPDTVQLSTFTIKAKARNFLSAYTISIIDSAGINNAANHNLADILNAHSMVTIRSYGPGNLATASIRGSGSTHTRVLWNGISVESPMMGQLDFSTVPAFAADELKIYESGSSLILGSGGIGGSILIENSTDWRKESYSRAGITAGSFGEYAIKGEVYAVNGNFFSRTRVQHLQSENNFQYKDLSISLTDPPTKTREDAAINQTSLLQEFSLRDSSIHRLSALIWLQASERGIPSGILSTTNPGSESLDQKFARTMLSWKKNSLKGFLEYKAGWFTEKLHYVNKTGNIDSKNNFNKYFIQIDREFNENEAIKYKAQLGVNYDVAGADSYDDVQNSLHTTAMMAASVSTTKKLNFDIILRSEWMNGYKIKMLPSIALNYKLLEDERLHYFASASVNTRFPGMNDLYWVPGGNPDLKPENSFTAETGFQSVIVKNEAIIASCRIQLWYSEISNWIQWLPDSVFSYWRPLNIKNAITRGIEIRPDFTFIHNKYKINFQGNYTWRISEDAGDEKLQMAYVPENTANSSLSVSKSNKGFGWNFIYTGMRYTSASNETYLPGHFLNNVHIFCNSSLGGYTLNASFHILNLLNTDYHVMAWHPMPGRHFRFSLLLSLPVTSQH